MTYLERVQFATQYDLSNYAPVELEGAVVGYVHLELAEALADLPEVFRITESGLSLHDSLGDHQSRTEAFESILPGLREAGFVRAAVHEQFEVARTLGGRPLMAVDRSAVEEAPRTKRGQPQQVQSREESRECDKKKEKAKNNADAAGFFGRRTRDSQSRQIAGTAC